MRALVAIGAFAFLAGTAFGQPEPKPSFEIADVHASGPSLTQGMRGPSRQGVRWGLKNGTMAELIAFAYGVDSDKVLGGPNWLEFDRFDVIAKAAPDTPPEKLKAMLQALLADRFQLVSHSDTKPFPALALTAGKNHKLKESDGSGQAACSVRQQAPTFAGFCHNESMEAFVNFMRRWTSPAHPGVKIVDQTELKGAYDLEFQFSPMDPPQKIVDGIIKDLGLKLEAIQIPAPVIVVDSVNRKPTANSPDVAVAFPPPPSEFEVASLKPSAPLPAGGRAPSSAGVYQSNRLTRRNVTLTQLIYTAWNIYNSDQIAGLPKSADTDRYDVMATVPESIATAEGGTRDQIDLDLYRPMYRKLLADRFQMKSHFENRPVNTWVLTAVKPKLRPADAASRTKWTDGLAPGAGRLVNCTNMTMAEFAALLPYIAQGSATVAVLDETGLQGSWDFGFTFNGYGFDVAGPMVGRGGDAAPDPSAAISLKEALSKLGLKLELQKRLVPVLVIDHIEPKPTEN